MRRPALLLPLAGGALIVAAHAADQKPMEGGGPPSHMKRQFMSCEQTYGQGWIPCGDEGSAFCYSPGLNHTCCVTDNGYCEAGGYCAPAAGYCCPDTEDVTTCATNAGFRVPLDAGLADAAIPYAVPATSKADDTRLNTSLSHDASSSLETTTGGGSSGTSAKSGPYIQVSVARKQKSTLAWMSAGIAAVGLFMFTC